MGKNKVIDFRRRHNGEGPRVVVQLIFTVADGRWGVATETVCEGGATNQDMLNLVREFASMATGNGPELSQLLGVEEPGYWCEQCYPQMVPRIIMSPPQGRMLACQRHGMVPHWPAPTGGEVESGPQSPA